MEYSVKMLNLRHTTRTRARSLRSRRLGGGYRRHLGALLLLRHRPQPLLVAHLDEVVLHQLELPVVPHRRFDLLLEAARRLFAVVPEARLLIVGRGTRRGEVAEAPARELGIADRVIFAGYRNQDYAEVLRQIEVFSFLVPGSDGTCRALLEAAACAIPAVVSERGALPEIVLHRQTGLVVPEDAGALASAWQELLSDPERRADVGRAAYERARAEFTPERLADTVEALYGRVRGTPEAADPDGG